MEPVLPLPGGGDVEGADIGLGGVGRAERGDAGDGGVVAAAEVFGAVIISGGWREPAAERVDEVGSRWRLGVRRGGSVGC